jgi:glycine cleavage system pyridoxal-binding protein P
MKVTLTNHEKFEKRHQGKMSKELVSMCNEIGVENIEQLIDETVPASISYFKEYFRESIMVHCLHTISS